MKCNFPEMTFKFPQFGENKCKKCIDGKKGDKGDKGDNGTSYIMAGTCKDTTAKLKPNTPMKFVSPIYSKSGTEIVFNTNSFTLEMGSYLVILSADIKTIDNISVFVKNITLDSIVPNSIMEYQCSSHSDSKSISFVLINSINTASYQVIVSNKTTHFNGQITVTKLV